MLNDLLHLLGVIFHFVFDPTPLKLLLLATVAVTLAARYGVMRLAAWLHDKLPATDADKDAKYVAAMSELTNDLGRLHLSNIASDASALIKTLGWRSRVRYVLLITSERVGIGAFILGGLIGALFLRPPFVAGLVSAGYSAAAASILYRHIWWLRRE